MTDASDRWQQRLRACSSPVSRCHAGLAGARSTADENGVRFVAGLDQQALGEVFFGMVEGVENHALDLLVRQAVGGLDFDLAALPLRCSRAETCRMPSASMRNLTSMRGRPADMGGMPLRSKRASERQSAASSRSPCNNMDGDVGLAVDAGGEVFGSRSGNGRVALDDARDGAAQRFNAERERRHVEQQHFLRGFGCAGENVGLHGGAKSHHFVGIEFGVRLLARARSDGTNRRPADARRECA